MNLHYTERGKGYPLVFLHGLFGSGSVWIRIAERFSKEYRCILPDLPGHGDSPAGELINYPLMAKSVISLLDKLRIDKCVCIGHSVGGKTAMACAVKEPNRLDGFVAGDISPRDYPPAHEKLIEALNGIDLDEIGERKQADLKLSERIPNPVIRSFLLKNLKRKDSRYTWRIDLESLERSMEPLSSWPEELKTKKYQGPALFLRGERSDYIKSDDISGIRKIFPNAQIKTVEDAGHWIHFDNRDTFTDMLSDFLHQVHK
jgi:esterase